ncbi:unnamed protein product [Angiostrongylus costaricensis]|uniref:Acyl_transf_3 domain-containing protein n=1 Tax=Angiostrongylus costaricensis TaxID=334426 RepID=A0A0R3Q056_ANGCS|nr:unnamed protein product [Angiostrongylus costaricensis]
MGVGYFLAQCIRRKPKLPKVAIILGWVIATSVALCCLYGIHDYQIGEDNWSKFTRGTYNNLSRIGWALAVSWVIVANHLGWGGLIATFMDHPIWQPLGKLSYCAYIVHYFVIRYYVYRVIPVVVLSYLLAFIWSCLFEIPTANLEKLLIATLIPQKKTQTLRSNPVTAQSPDKEIDKNDNQTSNMKF